MYKATWFSIASALLLLVGCGGGGNNGSGQVAGRVTDIDGNIVSGATITVDGSPRNTLTNSDGRYVIDAVPADDLLISAAITLNGTRYVGSNLARVFDQERAKNVDIVVVPQSQTATVHAIVWDNSGNLVQGARVFALPTNGNVLTSAMAVTNSDGECWVPALLAGQDYTLLASARGFQSSPDNVNLSAKETRDVNFTLGNAVNTGLQPPSGLSARSWTTPSEITRSPGSKSAYEAVKNRLDPRRAARKLTVRSTSGGNNIEVDLFWTPITTTDPGNSNKLLGYGIYRGLGSGASTTNVDYLRDPLASFYSDLDDLLVEGQTYTYQMTSLNTLFPDSSGSESAKSAAVTAATLGDLTLGSLLQGPLTFQWVGAIGATEYTVYLYDTYPAIETISPIWTSTATPQTQVVYGGPALTSGHVYYYYVVGDNGASGFTISEIAQFAAN